MPLRRRSTPLEEADDLAVLGIRGHPLPGFRREGRRAGFDDRVEARGHGMIRSLHLGDLREHGAFPIRLVLVRARGRLQLLGAFLHRGSFLVRESRTFLWYHRNFLKIVIDLSLKQSFHPPKMGGCYILELSF